MADEVDLAQDLELNRTQACIAQHSKTYQRLMPIGMCYYCDESLTTPKQLFCDADCGTDWEKIQRQARNMGLIGPTVLSFGLT